MKGLQRCAKTWRAGQLLYDHDAAHDELAAGGSVASLKPMLGIQGNQQVPLQSILASIRTPPSGRTGSTAASLTEARGSVSCILHGLRRLRWLAS